MKRKKIDFKYIIIVILIFFTIILGILFCVSNRKNYLFFEKIVKDISLYSIKIISLPIESINKKITEEKLKNEIYETYKDKEKDYKKMELLNSEIIDLKSELNDLEEMLKLNSNMIEDEVINATTISRNVGYWYDEIIIDKGETSGISVGDAVINDKGLIGIIDKTTNLTSTVKLLTLNKYKDKISIKIEVGDSFIYGLLTGYNKDKNEFIIEGISENTGIPIGSKIMTSGFGNNFPSGIIICNVKDTVLDHFEIFNTIYATPTVNFDNLKYVTVLKGAKK